MKVEISNMKLSDEVVAELTGSRFWFGPSGVRVTGEAVARHAMSAAGLMERENWDPQIYNPYSGHHLHDALHAVRRDGMGDEDTQYVVGELLRSILRIATGAPWVEYEAWSEHSTRTLAEVAQACQVVADLAVKFGPPSPPVDRNQIR